MLPVVPVALNLRFYFFGMPIEDTRIILRPADVRRSGKQEDLQIDLTDPSESSHDTAGYLSAILRILKRFQRGFRAKGLKLYARSEIPIGAGMGSSGALEVAFLTALNRFFSLGLTNDSIAEYSYLAESFDLGIPCGRLDQYAATFGGAIVLHQRPIISVERLKLPPFSMVVIDSGEQHRTEAIHSVRQAEIDEGLAACQSSSMVPKSFKNRLGRTHFETDWENINRDELARFLFMVPEKSGKRILFTIQMNDSTKLIVDFLKAGKIERKTALEVLGERRFKILDSSNWAVLETIGETMNLQHELLRDLYDVSTDKLEILRDLSLMSGGLGVKISGAGLGGCLIALVRDKDSGRSVRDAVMDGGAKDAWILDIDHGAEYLSG